jgi:hypothetical protein
MERDTKKYLLISQLCLWLGVVICLVLIPHFLFSTNEGGLSNYGVHLKTVIPYSLGFLAAIFFVVEATLTMKPKSPGLRQLLLGYSAALLLVLITTYGYKTNVYLKNTHIAVTIVFFWFELLAALWLCKTLLKDKTNIIMVILQLIGLIIGSLTFFGSLHLLFVSQLLTIIPFGIILIRSCNTLAKR